MMFSVVFMAFVCLFYLLFNSKLWSCSGLLQTTQMLFEMILLKYDTSDLTDAAICLGPIGFSLFILFIVFICVNMFISIIITNRSEYFDPIEDFPKRVDQLLDVINRVCLIY